MNQTYPIRNPKNVRRAALQTVALIFSGAMLLFSNGCGTSATTVAIGPASSPAQSTSLISVTPDSGTADNTLEATLTGTDFQPGSTVTVANAAATNITVVSSSKITAALPALNAGTYTITVTSSTGGTASLKNGVSYADHTAQLAVSTTSLPSATEGDGYSATLAATGGQPPYVWSLLSGSMPMGLTLSASGKISGSPSVAINSSITVQVEDADNNIASKALSLDVVAATTSGPGGGSTPPTLISVSPSSTPEGETVAATLTGANFESGSTVKVGGTGAVNVKIVSANQITATLPAMSAGTYMVQVIGPDGSIASLAKGITYTKVSTLGISTDSLSNATVGQPYSATLESIGGTAPDTWSITSGNLPAGLSLSTTGGISGAPTTAGKTTFSVQVMDSTGATAGEALTLDVVAATTSGPGGGSTPPTLISVSPSSTPEGETVAATLTGANFESGSTVKVGGTGAVNVKIVSANQITATLPAMSAGTYTVQVIGPDGSVASLAKGITYTKVNTLAISTGSLSNATVGQSYSATLESIGGTAPYTWSITSGNLPAGLSLSTTGGISGAPTTAGKTTFSVQVMDSTGETAGEALTLDVVAATPSGPSGGGTPPTGTALTACEDITQSGTYYLANDVTCTSTGFSINANNVVFNLNGHTITYGNSSTVAAAFMVCDSWYNQDSTTGVQIPGCSGSGSHGNMDIYGGTIVQAAGAASFSPVFWIGQAAGITGGQIHDLTATFSSTGSQFIHSDFPEIGWTIEGNVINDNVTNIQLPGQDPQGARISFQGVTIDLNNSASETSGSGNIIEGNTINGSPQGGIRDTSYGSQYLNNTITLSSLYSNDYGIVMYNNNQTASGNIINGRGRGIDAEYSNFAITSNQITTHEEADNSEYNGCELGGSYGIRIKNYAPVVSTSGSISHNTVTVAATTCDAVAIELTDLSPLARFTIANNTFTTTAGTGGAIDAALGMTAADDPQVTYTANQWTGTYAVFCNWDGCATTIQAGQTWSFKADTVNASDGNNVSPGTADLGAFTDFVTIDDTISAPSVVCGADSTTTVSIGGNYTHTCSPSN